jgi:hypothetical protein
MSGLPSCGSPGQSVAQVLKIISEKFPVFGYGDTFENLDFFEEANASSARQP